MLWLSVYFRAHGLFWVFTMLDASEICHRCYDGLENVVCTALTLQSVYIVQGWKRTESAGVCVLVNANTHLCYCVCISNPPLAPAVFLLLCVWETLCVFAYFGVSQNKGGNEWLRQCSAFIFSLWKKALWFIAGWKYAFLHYELNSWKMFYFYAPTLLSSCQKFHYPQQWLIIYKHVLTVWNQRPPTQWFRFVFPCALATLLLLLLIVVKGQDWWNPIFFLFFNKSLRLTVIVVIDFLF